MVRRRGVIALALVGLLACGDDSDPSEGETGETEADEETGETETGETGDGDGDGEPLEGYDDPALWLCHPDKAEADDQCLSHNLDATELLPDGSMALVEHARAEDPAFDCFYVYPTVDLRLSPGQTENFDDGSSRTIVTRQDGSRVVTIRDANLQVLRRTLVSADGTTTQLIDDTADVQPVDIGALPAPAPVQTGNAPLNEDQLREALLREANVDRRFTLSQIRNIPEVRALVAPVNIDAITFDTGSAAIRSDQAQQLQGLGRAIQDQIAQNPQEIFMIEGHTDTVGSDAANLALSDRRAESVALALTEYFDVPPENLVTQGYGEQFLRVRAEGDIRDNRRASVRRITDLLAQ